MTASTKSTLTGIAAGLLAQIAIGGVLWFSVVEARLAKVEAEIADVEGDLAPDGSVGRQLTDLKQDIAATRARVDQIYLILTK